ncbi:MAG TPA: DNA methyltransferase [Nocardioidaceae bacterium]|nr:DNA methyltransferase [Nocardioidaceae bacterium]
MTPYYEDDSVTLYLGDALAVLRELPDASVDAVVTDPPYSSGGFTRGDRTASTRTKYTDSDAQHALADFAGDNRDQRGYAYWCALWLSECLRVTSPAGVCLLFTDWRQLPATTDALQAGGWVWRGLVPWAKTGYRPMAGRFAAQCEYVVWGSRGGMGLDFTDTCLPGFFLAAAPREREHITQKPVDVLRSLVQIAPRGGVILDPFMGSGTTGVAAVLEGRRFVGAEVVPAHAETGEQRIRTAAGQAIPKGAQGVLGFGAAS